MPSKQKSMVLKNSNFSIRVLFYKENKKYEEKQTKRDCC